MVDFQAELRETAAGQGRGGARRGSGPRAGSGSEPTALAGRRAASSASTSRAAWRCSAWSRPTSLDERDPGRRRSRFAQCAGRWPGLGAVRRAGRGEPGADDRAAASRCAAGSGWRARRASSVRALLIAAARALPRRARQRAGDHPHLLRRAVPAGPAVPRPARAGAARRWPRSGWSPAPVRLPGGSGRELPPRGFASPYLRPARQPGQLLSELTVHRLLPGPAVAGLPARRHGRRPARPARRAGPGVARRRRRGARRGRDRGVTAPDSRRRVVDALLGRRRAAGELGPELLNEISAGMFGTTPTGGPWEWLLVVGAAQHDAVRPRPDDRQRAGGDRRCACSLVGSLRRVPACGRWRSSSAPAR